MPSKPDQKILKEISEIFEKPDIWLETENEQLGGQKPRALIDDGKGQVVRDLIQSIKYGAVT
jgi:hypothetical protein